MAVVDLQTSAPWQQALYGELDNPWYRGERAWLGTFAKLVIREMAQQHQAHLARRSRELPKRSGRPKRSGTMNDTEFMVQLVRAIGESYETVGWLTLDGVADALGAFKKRQLQRRMRECGLEWHPFQAIAQEFVRP